MVKFQLRMQKEGGFEHSKRKFLHKTWFSDHLRGSEMYTKLFAEHTKLFAEHSKRIEVPIKYSSLSSRRIFLRAIVTSCLNFSI